MLQVKQGRGEILEKAADHPVDRRLIRKKPQRQNGETKQCRGPCCADVPHEPTPLWSASWLETDLLGPDDTPEQATAANHFCCFHGLEMLGPEAGLVPFASDVENAYFPAQENRERDRIPDNGPGPGFSASVDLDHAHHF
jgi:hypothetical protein